MIVDHGTWIGYTPASPRADLEERHIMYARRDSPEAEDWYLYVASGAFGDTSVVMTVKSTETGDVVQAATYDPSEIFPAGFKVIEETEYTGDDPFADFNGHTYNADTRRIGDRWVPPPKPPTPAEARILQALESITARLDAIEKGR